MGVFHRLGIAAVPHDFAYNGRLDSKRSKYRRGGVTALMDRVTRYTEPFLHGVER